MKKLSTILAASALVLVSAQASAALVATFDIAQTITISGAYGGGGVGAGTGTLFDNEDGTATLFMSMIDVDSKLTSPQLPPGFSISHQVTSTEAELSGSWDGSTLTITSGSSRFTACEDVADPGEVVLNAVCGLTNLGIWGDLPAIDGEAVGTVSGSVTAAGGFNVAQIYSPKLGGDMWSTSDYSLTPTSAVPVPAAAWLFGSALVGLAGVGRKRKMA